MKKKIGVVFGGQSGEHEVSCVSAYHVIKSIPEDYEVVQIGISKDGTWHIYNGEVENIQTGKWLNDKENLNSNINLFTDLKDLDLFFPVLHGPMGEDGTIQGVFEMLNKPYVGCGVLASSVGMDKILTKIAFISAGIPTCKYEIITKKEFLDNKQETEKKLVDNLGLPIFVKPANLGSSVGVTKVHNKKELSKALEEAFKYDRRVIAEEFIDGREIECAILEEDGNVQAAIPGEITTESEFYDYEAKYNDDVVSEVEIPAKIPEDKIEEIRKFAIDAFKVIDGSGLSRVDFFYVDDTGDVLINEINTLPGFTPISMYPKMWDYLGVDMNELVKRLINTAAQKRTIII